MQFCVQPFLIFPLCLLCFRLLAHFSKGKRERDVNTNTQTSIKGWPVASFNLQRRSDNHTHTRLYLWRQASPRTSSFQSSLSRRYILVKPHQGTFVFIPFFFHNQWCMAIPLLCCVCVFWSSPGVVGAWVPRKVKQGRWRLYALDTRKWQHYRMKTGAMSKRALWTRERKITIATICANAIIAIEMVPFSFGNIWDRSPWMR